MKRSIMVAALIFVVGSMVGCNKEIKEAVRPAAVEVVNA